MANTTTTKTVQWTHGINTIYAGQPLDTNGKPVMDDTAVGIVAEDLHAPDKDATVITAGEWDESVNAARFHISDAVKLKLSAITFTPPPQTPADSYVRKTGETIEDLEDAPTADDFNGLLDALRASGIIETPEEPEK